MGRCYAVGKTVFFVRQLIGLFKITHKLQYLLCAVKQILSGQEAVSNGFFKIVAYPVEKRLFCL